jgi:hypothetical protein
MDTLLAIHGDGGVYDAIAIYYYPTYTYAHALFGTTTKKKKGKK